MLKECLKTIKQIELSRNITEAKEFYEGHMKFFDYSVYDGTVEEKYPKEISEISAGIDVLETLKRHIRIQYNEDLSEDSFFIRVSDLSEIEKNKILDLLENNYESKD